MSPSAQKIAGGLRLTRRHYSSKSSSKIKVLEKPAKFNPPSHPSRLVKPRKQYVSPLPPQELKAQQTRQYPNMMPPQGTFMHWFIHNKSIHVWITLGTLGSLAGYTFLTSESESEYGHMLPPFRDIFKHPISFMKTHIEVYKLNTLHRSQQVAEQRRRNVDDVAKREEYRKAHGLEDKKGFGAWFGGDKALPSPTEQIPVDLAGIGAGEGNPGDEGTTQIQPSPESRRKPLKKWLGIW